MMTRPLGKTGFSIAPLVFGGNVFVLRGKSFDITGKRRN